MTVEEKDTPKRVPEEGFGGGGGGLRRTYNLGGQTVWLVSGYVGRGGKAGRGDEDEEEGEGEVDWERERKVGGWGGGGEDTGGVPPSSEQAAETMKKDP